MSNLKRLTGNFSSLTTRRRGQILVVVAMAMLVMLITAGLATDVGILLMRKAQFDRAVDGAALAGAPLVSGGVPAANDRGMQILTANGIAVPASSRTSTCPLDPDDLSDDYCGLKEPGSLPGAQRYRVEARWRVPLAFMQLAKVNDVTLTSSAVAEYLDTVDTYTSESDQSIIQTSNLELFGPSNCTSHGDPYTPLVRGGGGTNTDYGELNGVYTFRIAIPPTFLLNKVRVELLDPQTGNSATIPGTIYRTNGSAVPGSVSCGDRQDPCAPATGETANPFWFIRMDENRNNCGTPSGGYSSGDLYNTRTLFRLYYYKQLSGGGLVPVDLAYYLGKMDDASGQTGGGRYSNGTWTAVQTHAEAQAEAVATMLKWISPGAPASERMPAFNVGSGLNSTVNTIATVVASAAEPATVTENCNSVRNNLEINNSYLTAFPVSLASSCVGNGDFIVDLENEASDIYEDPGTQVRHLYLDVRGLYGGSENNWAVWAGPAIDQEGADITYIAPSEVNARQVYLLRHKNRTPVEDATFMHSSQGIVTYGVGHLPMNSDASNRVRFPLAYLGPEFSGLTLKIRLFDADSGTKEPVIFYLDTIPQNVWQACYVTSANVGDCVTDEGGKTSSRIGNPENLNVGDVWGDYEFTIPSDEINVPFYGGRLMVYYQAGGQDSFGWKVTVLARPTLVQ